MNEHIKEVFRLHPRLRLIENGSMQVNACRSELSTQVASGRGVDITADEVESGIDLLALQGSVKDFSTQAHVDSYALRNKKLSKRKKLEATPAPNNAFINVIIDVTGSGGEMAIKKAANRVMTICETDLNGRVAPKTSSKIVVRQNQILATIPVSFLKKLLEDKDVAFVSHSEPLKLDIPDAIAALKPTNRKIGKSKLHKEGADVIIGIIDVGGFDFAHSDFLDKNGKTRFARIWDQGGDFRAPPERYDYGSEFTSVHLNAALRATNTKWPPPMLLEPQSQMSSSSHATHVASIAAGNSGICSKAEIVGVLIDVPVPQEDFGRRRHTFTDSSRILHAVEYLIDYSAQQQKPISINISLGTNGGAHDGLSATNRWLDNVLTQPWRSISLAAGNAGQESPQHDEDIGWIMGRIHSSGLIKSRGLSIELEWVVVGNGIADISENELEIWYSPQDRFGVELLPPGESRWFRVQPQEFIENKRLSDGTTVSIYNELFHPSSGGNYIALYLSPNLEPGEYRGVRAGIWRVRLTGEEVRNGRFHCWIERDDPHEFGALDKRRIFRFPSFFSKDSNKDSHSLSSLACGRATVAVSNYDAGTNKINITSSQGPTRDGRMKPDITAPGTNIVAANGFPLEGDPDWVSMTGTSMASPYVAGVIGLMMNAANFTLNSLQCLGILQRTAKPLPGTTYEWVNDAGFGRIDPEAAILEAKNFSRRTDKG